MKFHISSLVYLIILLLLTNSQTIEELIIDSIKNYSLQNNTEIIIKTPIQNENNNYIVYNFLIQNTSKIQVYISNNKEKANNKETIFKLPLYGEKTIIIPKNYYKSKNNLYLNITCEYNCFFEINVKSFNMIHIEEDQTISLSSFDNSNEYIFNYKYSCDKIKIDNEIKKNIYAYSTHINNFDMEISFIEQDSEKKLKITEKFIQGYFYQITPNIYKPCENCYFKIMIKIKNKDNFISLSIDNHYFNNNKIIPNKKYFGLIPTDKNECFYFNSVDEFEYFIDFFVDNPMNSFEFKNLDGKIKIINFSKNDYFINEKQGTICLNRITNSNIKKPIPYQFIIYNADKMTINQPFISIIDNTYLIERKVKMSKNHIYRPSILNKEKTNFYIYNNNGYMNVMEFTCENFPYCIINDVSATPLNYTTKNYYSFGNEFYGTIDNYNPNLFNSKTNLLIIQCVSGRDFYGEENEGKCSFNIIFYSDKDILNIVPNKKFSLLNNYNKKTQTTLKFYIPENNMKKTIINTYTFHGSTYPILKNAPKDTQIYYYGNLISIEFINEKTENYTKEYELLIENDGKDLTSILISLDEGKEKVEEYLWFNQDILVTLSEKTKSKKIIIDHIPQTSGGKELDGLISHFHLLNCDVNIKYILFEGDNIYKSLKFDNFLYMNIEKDFSEFNDKVEFDIELINTFQGEEICMIYFTSYLLDNYENVNGKPIILNENIPSKMFFDFQTVTDVKYYYLILNYEKPTIINFEFNDFSIFSIGYSLNHQYNLKLFTLYHSNKIIIYPNEIKKNCTNTLLCKLYILVQSSKASAHNDFTKKSLFTITVKTMDELPVTYINSNSVFNDIIIGKQIQYYYSNIGNGDKGSILINNKKGSGILFAKIYSSSSWDYIPNWQNKIYLPTKDDKQEENLIFDINKNEISFNEKHTSKCSNFNKCQILIGVISNDHIEGEDDEKSVYEYSIHLIKNKNNSNNSIVTILPNDYIQGNLYDTINNNYFLYYKYRIPINTKGINYEIHCKSCILVINFKDEIPDMNKFIFKLDVSKDRPFIIPFNDIEKYQNEYMIIGIGCKSFDDVTHTTFSFKIYPSFKAVKKDYILMNNEHSSICFKDCRYIIPILKYDLIKNIIISVSNDKGESNKNIYLSSNVYDFEYYINQVYSIYIFSLDVFKPLETFSKKENHNYLEIKSSNFQKDIFVEVNLTIPFNDENSIFYVYFTYTKDSHSDILIPNKRNLLFLESNKEKSFSLPYTEDKNINNYIYNQGNTSVAVLKQVKGIGKISLGKKFKYILDNTHNSFVFHYNKYSNLENELLLQSNYGLYFYANLYTKYLENIHEIQMGKTNYILYQLESFPVMIYVKVPNIGNYDITFNVGLEGIEESKYEWTLKTYLLNDNYIERRRNNNKLTPEYHYSIKGHFDLIRNRGTGIIRAKEIKNYNTNYNKIILFRLHEKSNKIYERENIIVKALAMSSHSNYISLPQYEYFYSRIQEENFNNLKPYNIYRLEKGENNHDEMKIEFASCYGDPNFSIKFSDFGNLDIYKNDSIQIIEDKVEFGKRILFIKMNKDLQYLYIYIFPNTEDKKFKDKEPINFTIKYFTFLRKEFKESKILDKNIKIGKLNNSTFQISWEPINSNNNQVDYFLKIFKRESFKNDNEVNSICLKNRPIKKFHLKNEKTIIIKEFPEGELFINLIAEYKESEIINNIISYNSLSIGFNLKEEEEFSIFKYIFIFFSFIIFFGVLLLYLYKCIRKKQVKNAYKLLGKSKFLDKSRKDISKQLPKNFSFVIDSQLD